MKKNKAPARPSSRQDDDEPEDLGHSTDLILFSSPEESAGDLVPLYQEENINPFIDASPPNNPQVKSETFDVSDNFGQIQLSSDSDNSNLFRNQHLEWDNYASSPSFSAPVPATVSVDQPGSVRKSKSPHKKCLTCEHSGYEAELTTSSEIDDEVIDDKAKDPDYDPKPRKRLQAAKRQLRRQNPLEKCRPQHRPHDAASSSDDDEPPPLPPRANRRYSVLSISYKTKPVSTTK